MIKESLILMCIAISIISCNKKSIAAADSIESESRLSENRSKPIKVADDISYDEITVNPDACLITAMVLAVENSMVEIQINELHICRTVTNEPKKGEKFIIASNGEDLRPSNKYLLEISFNAERKGNRTSLIKLHQK